MIELFKKWFLVKEIRSKTGELHFRRWRILQLATFAIYIHQIFRSDEDAHPHSHPWHFVSILLSGGYYEDVVTHTMLFLPGLCNHKLAHQYHQITLLDPKKVTNTLVFTYGPRHPWGYLVDGQHVDHVTYRKMKNGVE